ncbi:MAG TPA: YihY/virulence factor BrkB family protein [Usitatibacter sp.]|nr:YihY/virulence factor BrkB family protein [Usitatibacter sp.]
MKSRELVALWKEAFRAWSDDEAASMGAALAFYTLFSMAPLLLLLISLAGLVIGTDTARDFINNELTTLLGEKGASGVQTVLQAADDKAEGLFAATVSFLTLVLGATTVFAELRRDLDRIWKTKKKKTSGIWALIGARVWSFGLVLTIGFLLMVSLALSATVTALGSYFAAYLPGAPVILRTLEFLVSFTVITGLFAMIYKILPSTRIEWRDVWVGAAVTSLLFWIGKYLIGLYIAKSAVASPFGAAGTVVIVIVWVYYSAQIFFLGAEFTRAWALRRGSRQGLAA